MRNRILIHLILSVVATDLTTTIASAASIEAWGYDNNGQISPPAGNDFIAIAAGGAYGLALKSDGSIVGWGHNDYGQATPPAGNDYIAISAGGWHSLALKSDGSIVGWGLDNVGQASPPAGNDFVAIAARGHHSLALKPMPVVSIDIKPATCPNPLNVKSKGLLSVAICGSADFDVWTIDTASIRLEGVAPVRSSYEDVATPVADRVQPCECTTAGPDGQLDLTLKFNIQDIAAALGTVNNGDELVLTLTGALDEVFGGTPIDGTDCIVVQGAK